MTLEQTSANKSFGGWTKHFSHRSEALNCQMRFAVYLPPQAETRTDLPVVYWLSGLTCTDENFIQKAGAQKWASELGLVLVAPDTSPRGEGVADDEGYDLGQGAGFYVNATQDPWRAHYKMDDYIAKELPALVEANLPVGQRRSIFGHSMGGHGALTLSLRNPGRYQSVSAFSPIANPVDCPWGQKAFSAYLGDDQALWQAYDASALMATSADKVPTLVDQGEADNFLVEQLKPEALESAAKRSGYPLQLNRRAGYDHSYYFIASFMEEHLRFHAEHLN